MHHYSGVCHHKWSSCITAGKVTMATAAEFKRVSNFFFLFGPCSRILILENVAPSSLVPSFVKFTPLQRNRVKQLRAVNCHVKVFLDLLLTQNEILLKSCAGPYLKLAPDCQSSMGRIETFCKVLQSLENTLQFRNSSWVTSVCCGTCP